MCAKAGRYMVYADVNWIRLSALTQSEAEQLDPRHCMVVRGRRGEIESEIAYAPLVAVLSPFILVNALFGNHHKCAGQGNDISYPANTTVAVLITAEHTVSYTLPPQ